MPDQIIITEKTSQVRDIRDAVGDRYGTSLPAEGHLFDLVEPEDVEPTWRRWSAILLRPDELYATKPATGGNKALKLQAICQALRSAKRVRLATDCDRKGLLIGQEILEHYDYQGEVRRVMFTDQAPRPSARPSLRPGRTAITGRCTRLPSPAARPTRSTTCRSPAPPPSPWPRAPAP